MVPPAAPFLRALVQTMGGLKSEHLIVLGLDHRDRSIGFLRFPGNRMGAETNYRAIVTPALNSNAKALYLIHNHPSGDQTPSCDDLNSTAALAALLRPLQIAVADHLIVGAADVFSMANAGLIASPRRKKGLIW